MTKVEIENGKVTLAGGVYTLSEAMDFALYVLAAVNMRMQLDGAEPTPQATTAHDFLREATELANRLRVPGVGIMINVGNGLMSFGGGTDRFWRLQMTKLAHETVQDLAARITDAHADQPQASPTH